MLGSIDLGCWCYSVRSLVIMELCVLECVSENVLSLGRVPWCVSVSIVLLRERVNRFGRLFVGIVFVRIFD